MPIIFFYVGFLHQAHKCINHLWPVFFFSPTPHRITSLPSFQAFKKAFCVNANSSERTRFGYYKVSNVLAKISWEILRETFGITMTVACRREHKGPSHKNTCSGKTSGEERRVNNLVWVPSSTYSGRKVKWGAFACMQACKYALDSTCEYKEGAALHVEVPHFDFNCVTMRAEHVFLLCIAGRMQRRSMFPVCVNAGKACACLFVSSMRAGASSLCGRDDGVITVFVYMTRTGVHA